MHSKAATVKEYIAQLPNERKTVVNNLRKAVKNNLPKGFKEEMSYGMIGYVVPHSLYPEGYHCDPKLPLPFMNIASQKNFVALYHMGLYSDKKLLDWFTKEWTENTNVRLDMGKSCIRFKKLDQIPYALIGQLASKVNTADWIEIYESSIKKK